MREHFAPNGPVMLPVLPNVKPMVYVFTAQHPAESQVGVETDIPIGRAQDDVHVPKFVVVESGQVIFRTVEIHIRIMEAIHKILDVERAAHGKHVADVSRMAKGEIGGMVSAETTARYGDFARIGIVFHTFDDLMTDHLVIPGVVADLVGRVYVLVIETVFVDTVGTENLHQSLLNKPRCRPDEALVAVFMETAHRGREEDDGIAGMSENEHFDLTAQVRRMPLEVFFSHKLRLQQ